MITVPELAADALGSYLSSQLSRRFGTTQAGFTELVPWVARLALECIGNSDALYHNVEHTMMVTLVGYEMMKGRSLLVSTPASGYAHVLIACLLHDIGYVRGVLVGDGEDGYVVDAKGSKTKLPRGASDAALTPHHVERSKLFALERLAKTELLDEARIARAIEFTRFPSGDLPDDEESEEGCLVRAADLIGQLGDPHYLRKANALYHEFEEVGLNRQLGYTSPADLMDVYPQFYYNSVAPHIQAAIRYLNMTSTGRQWIASLYSNVFRAERDVSLSGPER
jgi:hypothetical protein